MRPLVMGVLNVTPDSFSDGGEFMDHDRAVSHGLELVAAGADVVDVGGESSRPGAEPVSEAEELRRVLPVVGALASTVRVSVDTTKKAVALAAIDAGATLVNDISAGLWEVAAVRRVRVGSRCTCRERPMTMQVAPRYDDVVVGGPRFPARPGGDGAGSRGHRGLGGPRDRFRKDARAQRRSFASPAGAGRSRLPGSRRNQPQGIPGHRRTTGRRLGHARQTIDSMRRSRPPPGRCSPGASMVRVHDVGPTVQAATLVGPTRVGRRRP